MKNNNNILKPLAAIVISFTSFLIGVSLSTAKKPKAAKDTELIDKDALKEAFEKFSASSPAYINEDVTDLPPNMTLPYCPDNQRYVYTTPSADYSSVHDGRLFVSDVINGIKTLIEMEFRSYHLSKLEISVARCMMSHMTNKNIGEKLHISEHTVKFHVSNIYKKMDCHSKEDFHKAIISGVENSVHSWRSRRELELDMQHYEIVSLND